MRLIVHVACAGVGGAREPDPVEYDLDNEDEDWLRQYNLGRNKLNDLLFEKMLWKLELACAEATDSALTAAGARGVVAHMALSTFLAAGVASRAASFMHQG
jgi:hypothetical protein